MTGLLVEAVGSSWGIDVHLAACKPHDIDEFRSRLINLALGGIGLGRTRGVCEPNSLRKSPNG